jgi:integrase
VDRWMKKMDLWSVPLLDVDVPLIEKTFAPLFGQSIRAAQAKLENTEPVKRGGGPGTDVSAVYKCLTHCTTAWNEAKGQKAPANPFPVRRKAQHNLPKIKRRTTVLAVTTTDGKAWLKGLLGLCNSVDSAEAMLADYVLLSVLWGGRKTEETWLRWRDINFDGRKACFAAQTTKANRDHEIPLTPWTSEILKARLEKNRHENWPVGPNDLVFPYPHTKTRRIEDYRPITRKLLELTGLWVRLHDLRRTFASAVFGSAKDLGTVAIALGHATGQEVTVGYLPSDETLDALREIYAARERKLRVLVELDASAPNDQELNGTQTAIIETMRDMMRKHGLNEISKEKLLSVLNG